MPPGWKTFDEGTAAALKSRVDEDRVSMENMTQPLFADGDSVVIAPTLQKGAALVITARRKVAPLEVAEAAPPVEEITAPELIAALPVEPAAEPVSPEPILIEEEPVVEIAPPETLHQEPEFTFGPTTWERVEEAELPGEFTSTEHETRSTDPEIWDLPSQTPSLPLVEEPAIEQISAPANSQWEEERYVATGFLGLDDYVEDDEELKRAKRPWWKRIFSD